MAASLSSIVEGILDHLYGHTNVVDASASVTVAIDASSLSLTVDDARSISAGYIEVDTELMLVKEVDLGSNVVTLRRRGVRGSTAAAHAVNAEVRIAPVMPYHSVIREVNAEIASLFPRVCAVATTEFDASAITVDYELPADAVSVLDVRWRDPAGHWQRVRHWETEFSQPTTDFASGIAIRAVTPDIGKIRVVYGKPFTPLSSLTDTLTTLGVPESLEDVIRMGATIRLLPSMDVARLSVVSVPAADSTNKSPQPGTGIQVARELRQQYTQRLVQEVATFRLRYPSRVHYTR